MTEQLNQIISNPWVTLFSFLIGVLGFVLAFYFGIRSLPKKKIKVFYDNNELITYKNTDISKLEIFYNKESVDRLTVTKVVFWNSSFPTINNSDIVNMAPFSVLLNVGTILDVSVLRGHDTSNKIDVKLLNDKAAQISFDYLDYKEGGILQIIHTGDEDSIHISKKLKGGCIKTVAQKKSRSIKYFVFWVILLAILILFVLCINKNIFPKSWYEQKEINTLKEGYIILIGVIFEILSVMVFIYMGIKEFREFIPKNCRKGKK